MSVTYKIPTVTRAGTSSGTTDLSMSRYELNTMLDALEAADPSCELRFTTKWGGCVVIERVLKDG